MSYSVSVGLSQGEHLIFLPSSTRVFYPRHVPTISLLGGSELGTRMDASRGGAVLRPLTVVRHRSHVLAYICKERLAYFGSTEGEKGFFILAACAGMPIGATVHGLTRCCVLFADCLNHADHRLFYPPPPPPFADIRLNIFEKSPPPLIFILLLWILQMGLKKIDDLNFQGAMHDRCTLSGFITPRINYAHCVRFIENLDGVIGTDHYRNCCLF